MKTTKKPIAYEKSHTLEPLRLFVVIVSYGQANAIMKYLHDVECSFSFITSGEGTGTKEMYELFGLSDSKKQIIYSLVKKEKAKELADKLRTRFSVSKTAAGIAFSIRLTSVAGISVYKFLTNTRKI